MTSDFNASPIKNKKPKSFWDQNYYESSPRTQKVRDLLCIGMIPTVMFLTYFGLQKVLGVLFQ